MVLLCSILMALEGGEGSIEFVRSWTAACGFADAEGGGLFGAVGQIEALGGGGMRSDWKHLH